MKVSEMITNLKVFMYENGDLDCWYAQDDEGNAYHEVYYEPTLYYVDEHGIVYTQEDFDDVDIKDIKWLTPVCVVN